MSRRLQITLHVLFSIAALGFALLITFPYAALGRLIESKVAKAMPGATLAIDVLGPAFPLGLSLRDITLTVPQKDGADPRRLEVDRVVAKPAWGSLLTGKPGVSFRIDAFDGTVTGTANATTETRHLVASVDSLDLGAGGQLERLSGMKLAGLVNGDIDLTADVKNTITDGTVDLRIDDAKLITGKVMGLAISATDLGTPELKLAIEKGEGKIGKLGTKSGDLELAVTGTLQMRTDLPQTLINGNARVKLMDAWLGKNGTIKGLLGMAGSFKKPDGALELPLNGTLARPSPLLGMAGIR